MSEPQPTSETTSVKIDFEKLLDKAWFWSTEYKFLYLLGIISVSGSMVLDGYQFRQYLLEYEPSLPSLDALPILVDLPNVQAISYLDNTSYAYLGILGAVLMWVTHFTAAAALIRTVVALKNQETPTLIQSVKNSVGAGFKFLQLNLMFFGGFYALMFLVVEEVVSGRRPWYFIEIFHASSIGCLLMPLFFISWLMYVVTKRTVVYHQCGVFSGVRYSFELIVLNLRRLMWTFVFLGFTAFILPPVFLGLSWLLEVILASILPSMINPLIWVLGLIAVAINVVVSVYISIFLTLLFLDCNDEMSRHLVH